MKKYRTASTLWLGVQRITRDLQAEGFDSLSDKAYLRRWEQDMYKLIKEDKENNR